MSVKVKHGTRKFLRIGGSKGITFPKEWVEQHGDPEDLHLLYNDFILVVPPDCSIDKRTEVEKVFRKFEEESKRDGGTVIE